MSTMKRFVQGDSRTQSFLLPEALDDYVTDTNPVRVVDVFVDELDLQKLGFEGVEPALTGRPSYHPEVMLKIYIYGYLNRIQSSRRLEREAQRNVELMWLTGRRAPDFKTIARFRKDNGKAIRSVCRQFVVLCQPLDLFAEAIVAIVGWHGGSTRLFWKRCRRDAATATLARARDSRRAVHERAGQVAIEPVAVDTHL